MTDLTFKKLSSWLEQIQDYSEKMIIAKFNDYHDRCCWIEVGKMARFALRDLSDAYKKGANDEQ